MTISSETTKQTFLGNGAQSVFTYTFLLPTAAQYTLHYVDAAGAISLVSQADYTVSGIGVATGGSLTYLRGGSPIANGTSITLVRAVPYTQTTELNNQGAYYPSVIESALDRLDMQIQQLWATSRLSFKAPVTNANVADVPTADSRASSWAYWDEDGNLTSTTTAWPGGASQTIQITGGQTLNHEPTGNHRHTSPPEPPKRCLDVPAKRPQTLQERVGPALDGRRPAPGFERRQPPSLVRAGASDFRLQLDRHTPRLGRARRRLEDEDVGQPRLDALPDLQRPVEHAASLECLVRRVGPEDAELVEDGTGDGLDVLLGGVAGPGGGGHGRPPARGDESRHHSEPSSPLNITTEQTACRATKRLLWW